VLRTGRRAFKWLDAPHVPHGWDNGFMMELETRTMFPGDLFTQSGSGAVALTEATSSGRARTSGRRWTTTPMRRIPRRCWRSWRGRSR
jgi:hypothetical protein